MRNKFKPRFTVEQNVIRIIRANFLIEPTIKVTDDSDLKNELNFDDIEMDKLGTLIEWYFSIIVPLAMYTKWAKVKDVITTINESLVENSSDS